MGDRSAALGKHVNLDTHIDDVAQLLEFEDLRGVILVGHSYGGMVITGAAERAAERIARLVFLDADVPADGQSSLDPDPEPKRKRLEARARKLGDGWLLPPASPESMGVTDPADARWVKARLRPIPLACFTQPVKNTRAHALPHTYILCTATPRSWGTHAVARRVKAEGGWDLREVKAGHDAMLAAPEALARELLAAAALGT
jgi:pimeloyl-ACP methyl ester carboxylesterase